MVLDNAEDKSVISKWWPHGKAGSILITTLDPSFATSSVAGQGKQLLRMEEADAISMMLTQVSRHSTENEVSDDRAEARELARRVGFWPVAIQSCIGAINDTNRSLYQYNRGHADSKAILSDATADKVDRHWAPYGRGLNDLLRARLAILDDDDRALVDLFSLLDPDNIPEMLLDILETSKDLITAHPIRDMDKSIARLSKGLVTRDSSTTAGDDGASSFYMHRLLRDYLRMSMTQSSSQSSFELATELLYVTIARPKPTAYHKSESQRVQRHFQDYFSHVEYTRLFLKTSKEPMSPTPMKSRFTFCTSCTTPLGKATGSPSRTLPRDKSTNLDRRRQAILSEWISQCRSVSGGNRNVHFRRHRGRQGARSAPA